MNETVELVLVPFARPGAEALNAAAAVGLEGAEDAGAGVDVDAGYRANEALRRALDADPDAEVAIVQRGVLALEAIFSHDKDFVLIDESDSVGFIAGEDYTALYQLLALLRDGTVETSDAVYADGVITQQATATLAGVRASVVIERDPNPEFADTHLRVSLLCDPPPRGSHREVYSCPILLRDTKGDEE